VERRLAEVLAQYGWAASRRGVPPPVRMMSFSQLALTRMRQLAPDVPRVLLVEERIPLRFREGALPKGVDVMGLDIRLLRRYPAYAERLHRRGHRLHVWTVDDMADVDLCLSLGVDAIITNRPRQVLAHLGRTSG
jgi:glycerophosphoryl diester phosphodiesterase